jgi:hypothetical protein
MTGARMHADEVTTDVGLVRRLLAAQCSQWADLPLTPVPSAGTDNAIYRLGEDKAVRLPRIHWATGQIAKERTWLPRLASHLPLELPVQLAVGEVGDEARVGWGYTRMRLLDGWNRLQENQYSSASATRVRFAWSGPPRYFPRRSQLVPRERTSGNDPRSVAADPRPSPACCAPQPTFKRSHAGAGI